MADGAVSAHPAVQAQLDRLAALGHPDDALGLERVTALCEALGAPQDALPPVFHVAGTNGKGSTVAFLRAALEAAGKSVHVFTSPHLVNFNERIRLSGKLIGDDALADLLATVLDKAGDIKPTFFEATTAAAFYAFAHQPADAALIEVGLGGRLDATNIVERPLVTGIAALARDHERFLGRRLPQIAAEKAGIAKKHVPLVTQRYEAALERRIDEVAQEKGAILLRRGRDWEVDGRGDRLAFRSPRETIDLPLPRMTGRHQVANAGLAIAMIDAQGRIDVPRSALSAAMGWADWPARMQRITRGPLAARLPDGAQLWLDGAHNEQAAQALAAALPKGRRLSIVTGILANRPVRELIAPFKGRVDQIIAVPITGHDHHPPAMIADTAASFLDARRVDVAEGLEEAFARLDGLDANSDVLVMGSLYLAGEMLRLSGLSPT